MAMHGQDWVADLTAARGHGGHRHRAGGEDADAGHGVEWMTGWG
jgi:hypothetical protein